MNWNSQKKHGNKSGMSAQLKSKEIHTDVLISFQAVTQLLFLVSPSVWRLNCNREEVRFTLAFLWIKVIPIQSRFSRVSSHESA